MQSVEIAATILTTLASEGGVLPLKRLAAATKMPRAKVHRYLVSLRRAGLVAQDPTSGQYRIGSAAITVGLAGLQSQSPIRHIYEALPALRDRIDETVTLAIWGDAGPVIIAMEESRHVVTMNVRVGSTLPLLNSAIGRVFTAYLPSSLTRGLIAGERKRTAGGLPSSRELASVLDGIRARRLGSAQGAMLPGVNALAAPVFDHRGKLLAALCAVGRAETFDMAPAGTVARALRETSDILSRQLGFIDGSGPAAGGQSRGAGEARS